MRRANPLGSPAVLFRGTDARPVSGPARFDLEERTVEPLNTNETRQIRPPYRPPVGIPAGQENRRLGLTVSVALHVLVAILILVPFTTNVVTPILQGAGGPGPAGGGGGGRGGGGGASRPVSNERLSFIQVAPETPPPAPQVTTPPPEAVVPPKPVEEPRPVPPPAPETKADSNPTTKSQPTPDVAAAPGTGGGSGTDGTNGSGPGSGGGTGTGIGTGRGSGVGPGTGGGTQVNYPPLPIEMFLPPMPIPPKLRGFRVTAQFDVDETGRVVSFKFTETSDGGYNRKLRDVVRSIRFRPGSRPDGTPVRMTAQIEWIL
jgi:protein TonB